MNCSIWLRIRKKLHSKIHKNCVFFTVDGKEFFILCYQCKLGQDKFKVFRESHSRTSVNHEGKPE